MSNADTAKTRLTGLIAATYAPMDADGSLSLARVPALVEHLIAAGLSGLYVNGSTGEAPSLTTEERMQVAEAYAEANAGRLPLVVQLGHNCLRDARTLAAHAQKIGADAVSACPPSYFPIANLDILVASMAHIADAAPDLSFYYYNIPQRTGVEIDMPEFLRIGAQRIPTLRGTKYTAPTVNDFQACLRMADGSFDCLWGSDQMLLSALAVGATGAVGTTYNFAAPLYRRVIDSFQAGDMAEAQRCQALAVTMIRTFARYPRFPAMKMSMSLLGQDCGQVRLPQPPLHESQVESLRADLEAIGFFRFSQPGWDGR